MSAGIVITGYVRNSDEFAIEVITNPVGKLDACASSYYFDAPDVMQPWIADLLSS